MRIKNLGGKNIGYASVDDLLGKGYGRQQINLDQYEWAGPRRLSKAQKNSRIIGAPISQAKLLKLAEETDEYHWGCLDAKVSATLMQAKTSNKQLQDWLEAAKFPGNEYFLSVLREC